MRTASWSRARRAHGAEAGIAIGPLLFIIAIIGVLAIAIAASSGSFNGGTASESARLKASSLIQIGGLLKAGFARMTGSGTDFDSINIDPTATTNDNDLFAPSGGSVNVPSVTLANNPAVDVWHYPLAVLPHIGTGQSDRLAMLKVAKGVCNEVNIKANAIATDADDSTLTADIGDVTVTTLTGAAQWPTPLDTKEVGCVHNGNGTTPGYFYFQVLGIR